MRLGDASSSRRSDAAVLSAEDCRWLEELDELRKAGAGQAAGVGLTSLVSMRIDKLGVRRGEPGAAEKRALIGAQRSVHPETLAMIDLFAISRAEDEALRRQRGLHDPKSTEQFAHDMRSLGGRWGAMSAAERADAIGRRINARLGDIEVPAVKIKTLDLGPSNGHFDFRDWSVAVNAQRLDAPVIGSDLLGGVTNTIYHEARHAEQWYLMARLMAARRMSPDEIARTATIPLPVAEAAAHAPPLSRAQASAAQLFYNSVYGVHAAHRDQVNHQLGHLNTALTVAGRAFEESVVNPFMSPVEKQQKASEFYYLQHLHAQWNNAYLALPEEQDAWAAGHAAERAYQYSLTGPPPRG